MRSSYFKRIASTVFFGIGKSVAVFVAVVSFGAFVYFGYMLFASGDAEYANALTGAGAVLASCISAFVAYRTIAILEETQKPFPYPYIDTKSRHGLSLLKLKNAGGSSAHHVYLEWSDGVPAIYQASGNEGKAVNFADSSRAILVLIPGDEQATVLGVHHWLADQLKALNKELKGHVVFRDVKGNEYREPFFIDISFFEWAIADETEQLRAQYATAQIPDALKKVVEELRKISRDKQL
jgi:hypothetical protein